MRFANFFLSNCKKFSHGPKKYTLFVLHLGISQTKVFWSRKNRREIVSWGTLTSGLLVCWTREKFSEPVIELPDIPFFASNTIKAWLSIVIQVIVFAVCTGQRSVLSIHHVRHSKSSMDYWVVLSILVVNASVSFCRPTSYDFQFQGYFEYFFWHPRLIRIEECIKSCGDSNCRAG